MLRDGVMRNHRAARSAPQQFDLAVSSFAFGGEAIGRLPDGRVCFVFGAAPGDFVRVELEQSKKSYARARLSEVLEPSVGRIESDCPYSSTCPGCAYRHVSYSCELAWKQKQFQGFLLRGGALARPESVQSPFAAPARKRYRSKLTFFCESGRYCYRGLDNRTATPVQDCLLGCDPIGDDMRAHPVPPDGRCVFRWTKRDGVLRSGTPEWDACSFLTESWDGIGEFQVPPNSFFQTNPEVAKHLALAASEAASEHPFLIELFSGVGAFSILAAKRNPELRSVGVEFDPLARPFAERNAALHGVASRCRFVCGDASKAFSGLASGLDPARTCVLLDPPRTGLSPELAAALTSFKPARIVYVSCSADTLRRDLERIVPGGWEIVAARMFDMFPATAHFESLTVLDRERR